VELTEKAQFPGFRFFERVGTWRLAGPKGGHRETKYRKHPPRRINGRQLVIESMQAGSQERKFRSMPALGVAFDRLPGIRSAR
jgi:hypothetical protein